MSIKISLIIPTFNRCGVLEKHLDELEHQTISRKLFEVIVVDDGSTDMTVESVSDYQKKCPYKLKIVSQKNSGPAIARNTGADAAENEIFVLVGDDVIPHPHLLYRHWLNHIANDRVAVQGYTGWYPQLPPLDFENFLYESGLQANWASLKNPDGSWKRDGSGYCLTTNFSIHRAEFEKLGGFDEVFPNAAWEDISLGFKGTKHGLKTLFEPDAINYHAHRQTLDGFVRRQQVEGRSRLILCTLHPELSGGLLDSQGLRDFSKDKFQAAVALARLLHFNSDPAVQEVRKARWTQAFRYASLSGVLDGIEERSKKCKVWLAIPHLHVPEQSHFIVSMASCLERGELGFANINAEWALREGQSNWAIWAAKGEVELASGRKREALVAFEKAVTLGPGEKWPLERMGEIL